MSDFFTPSGQARFSAKPLIFQYFIHEYRWQKAFRLSESFTLLRRIESRLATNSMNF